MAVLFLILLVLAAACFAAVAVMRRELLAVGLLFWVLVPLIQVIQGLAH